MRILMPILAAWLLAPAAATAAPRTLAARGVWAAFDHGRHCEAVARSELDALKNRPQARLGFRFDRAGPRGGELAARLSRVPRPGSSVILKIDGRPFLLAARGDWAWSRGPAQDAAIIAAARLAGSLRIEARDAAGRRFVDRYLLDGAPTAIDAAAAACALAK
ncbi:hypothetical protein [Sphingomonas sp.]|uniref:hypothetical protein n=1 Tax=Sphingomonas sp. TaxID=28214 RepID=UPI00286E58D0|nr:hypothetical protein [Sphingomonas sp.]